MNLRVRSVTGCSLSAMIASWKWLCIYQCKRLQVGRWLLGVDALMERSRQSWWLDVVVVEIYI